MDDTAAIDALHHAFARGVNFVDTAPAYGNGRSESLIGRAVRDWRHHRIYIATKVTPAKAAAPDDEHASLEELYPATSASGVDGVNLRGSPAPFQWPHDGSFMAP